MGRLTTHVLDTASGRPGAGISVSLFRLVPEREKVCETRTNEDGRCAPPLLEGEAMRVGVYELCFRVGDYFAATTGVGAAPDSPHPRFLDEVVIRFGIGDPGEHYHVPLLISPFGYTTYRGS